MKPTIKHVFFDLDRTLWDFDANSRLELNQLWSNYKLHQRGISLSDQFIQIYEKINGKCWAQYRNNEITKEELRGKRFQDTLAYFGIVDAQLANEISIAYLANSPNRTILVDGALDVLSYLKEKYQLHIITNGFKEVQHLKLNNCGLTPFFDQIIISEEVGAMKPAAKVFDYSIAIANAKKEESVYIGDDLIVDIEGANNAGWHTIYYNPNRRKHNLTILGDITELLEIKNTL